MQTLLVVILAIMPIISFLERHSVKRSVIEGKRTRISIYRETMLYLWGPTLFLGWIILTTPLSLADVGLGIKPGWSTGIGIGLVLFMLGYSLYCLAQVNHQAKTRAIVLAAMQPFAWLMPASKKEQLWFSCGVSTSAGICEELLFRGFLLYFFTPIMGFWWAVLVSSLMFGACHIYLGINHVMRTAILGGFLAFIYWVTGSIWFAIIIHALMDIHSGNLYYYTVQKESLA